MNIQNLIKNAGHESLLPIQSRSIEAFKKYPEIILISKTGSGKTMAFLLATITKIESKKHGIQAVIIAPTRELAQQIDLVYKSLKTGLKSTLCYGGHPMRDEANSLKETPTIVIGTPGRILDHIERGNINGFNCHTLVIDEFDKCLELGFEYEMDNIRREFRRLKNTFLSSATELDELPIYLKLQSPKTISNLSNDSEINIKEFVIEYQANVFEALTDVLSCFGKDKSIIFCNYREVVEDIVMRLKEEHFNTIAYHGGLDQAERERALIKYRNGSSNTLVCTDLGARGLDIPEVKHVVHYQYPGSKDAFVHRKGRTARMSKDGASYLFIGEEAQLPEYVVEPKLKFIPSDFKEINPEWTTLYFSGGKKEKINKIDLVGFLSKKGQLKKDEIGLITVMDHTSYVAVKKHLVKGVLNKIKSEKIKGKRLKIAISM